MPIHSPLALPRKPNPDGRVLVVDDDRALHDDYDRLFSPSRPDRSDLDALSAELFGTAASTSKPVGPRIELSHAHQGVEALELVRVSVEDGRRYAVAFVDVIMPPGWDGVETTRQIWDVDADIQVVICTAYSDFSWQETIDRVGRSDGLHLLRKPFDPQQVMRFATTLCQKWRRCRRALNTTSHTGTS